MKDDVPEEIKSRRLREVIDTFQEVAAEASKAHVGKVFLVLVEGKSRKSETDIAGRADNNRRVNFPLESLPVFQNPGDGMREPKAGDFVAVRIVGSSSGSFRGEAIAIYNCLTEFDPSQW